MPSGLQIFDAGGQVVLDTNTRVGTVIGALHTGVYNGSINVPGFALGQPFFTSMALDPGIHANLPPTVNVSGTTLSWVFDVPGAVPNQNCVVVYGVY